MPLTLAACSSVDGGLSASASAIVGASPANDHEEAALIDMPGAACSGAIIAPQVVLTAGHCIRGHTSWTVTAPYAARGAQRAEAARSEVYDYDETSELVNPGQHDIGLLYLSTPIRLSRYPQLAQAPLAEGSTLINIGRIRDGELSSTDLFAGAPVSVESGVGAGFPYAYSARELIESGDSGGPCETPSGVIAAVNSGGGGGQQILARVDLLASWISERVAANGGAATPTPTIAPGATPAGEPGSGGIPTAPGTGTTPGATAGPCVPEREPNNAIESASPLARVGCGILAIGDTDWFAFTLPSGGVRYTLDLASGGDATMVLYKQTQGGTWQRLPRDGRHVDNVSSYGGRYAVAIASPSASAQVYRVALAL